jgi:hypothetical protein
MVVKPMEIVLRGREFEISVTDAFRTFVLKSSLLCKSSIWNLFGIASPSTLKWKCRYAKDVLGFLTPSNMDFNSSQKALISILIHFARSIFSCHWKRLN